LPLYPMPGWTPLDGLMEGISGSIFEIQVTYQYEKEQYSHKKP